MDRKLLFFWVVAGAGTLLVAGAGSSAVRGLDAAPPAAAPGGATIVRSEAEWKKLLTPQQYAILREARTEPAFTGKYWNNHAKGIYVCAADGTPLFSSSTKFDSGTGWPSFWAPISKDAVATREDDSLFMRRTEVLCARCGGHLGHVFSDGPPPTHLRYCINSGALKFVPDSPAKGPGR